VVAGEPLVAGRLAPDGLTGAAALVPEGYRAVSVPTASAGFPPVALGDRVDVLAVLPPDLVRSPATEASPTRGDDAPAGGRPPPDGDGAPAFPLVERALVVDVADEAVAVAVPQSAAPRVAFALAQGSVVLALVGP
jgi:hypothetical protein